jgi:branched-subunit amino acid ABC-type transport system permease component
MQKLIEQLINGMTVGSFYALIPWATPWFTVVLSMINFATGYLYGRRYFGCFTITQLSASGFTEAHPILAIIFYFSCRSVRICVYWYYG